jgi:atypical dual specificity phosphatase
MNYYNFSFVIPEKLAGMSRPDREALELLPQAGVKGLLSLTEEGIPPMLIKDLEYLHLPIPDFTAPEIEGIEHAVKFIDYVKGPVAAHCFAGIGRTGTILAAYMVSRGADAPGAINSLRRIRPSSIETAGQEAVIYEYEMHLRENRSES